MSLIKQKHLASLYSKRIFPKPPDSAREKARLKASPSRIDHSPYELTMRSVKTKEPEQTAGRDRTRTQGQNRVLWYWRWSRPQSPHMAWSYRKPIDWSQSKRVRTKLKSKRLGKHKREQQ